MGKQKRLRELKKTQDRIQISKVEVSEGVRINFWQYIIPPFILTLLAVVFYAPSMHYSFQFDDIANILKCFNIRHHSFRTLFFSGTRWISYWLNSIYYNIGKFDPFSYRLGNVVIHITSGLLIFFILLIALKHLKNKNFFSNNALSIAMLTAVMFLLHPVQTQTVSYVIQGQLEGLAAMFILGLVLAFLKLSYAKTVISRLLFTTLLFCLAAISCGTKEIAIISPILILLVDWFFVAQGDFVSLKTRKWIHLFLGVIIIGCYIYFLKIKFFTDIIGLQKSSKNNPGNIITQNSNDAITSWIFFISQFKVIFHYLWIFIWPFNISVEYDWVLSKGLFTHDSFFPLMGLLAIGVVLWKMLRRNAANPIGFGFLWFFLSIAPRSSIIPSPELLVDYKTYTASFGWLFMISSFLIYAVLHIIKIAKVSPKFIPSIQYCNVIGAVLFAIPLGIFTLHRNTVWRSGIEFWGNIIKNAPGKARAFNNYGVEISQKLHDFRASIPYFKKAIEMDAKYSDPWNNLAVAYSNIGDVDQAIVALKQSLRICPYHPEGYNNLASFFIQKKEYQEAEKLLRIAIQLRPHYGKAYFNLGRIQLKSGDKEGAWKSFKKCCTECDFDNDPHGFVFYAKVSAILKKYEDAIFGYLRALELDPNYPDAAFNLASCYFFAQKYDQAISLYQQMVKANPTDFKILYNIGESYFAKGDFQKAIEHYQKSSPIKDEIPYWYVRTANCLERIGKIQEAKNILQEFIAIDSCTNVEIAKLQKSAREEVVKMNLTV